MAEETGSKEVVVRTLARHFQMIEDDFALYYLFPHRLIMGIPMLIHQVLELIRSFQHGLTHTLQIVVHQLLIANLSRGVEFSGNLRQDGQMEDEAAHLVVAEMDIQEIRLESLAVGGPLGK